MFWLVGGTGLALGIVRLMGEPWKTWLLPQLDHAEWIGFTFYDFIFPLFVFVVGMSIEFSLGKLLRERGKAAAYKRIFRRFVLLYLLGVLYYGGLSSPMASIRWLGVLQRIALCYLITGLLFCHLRTRGLAAVGVGILVGYWILSGFVPIPGHTSVSWAEGENWAAWVDHHFLPGSKHEGTWDANGLLGTLPAVSTCLLGLFASQLLLRGDLPPRRKVLLFLAGGVALVVAGYLWGLHFPIIKKIWTSSYVLVSGGYSLMLLGCFYLVLDVWKVRWWTAPFVWIGVNPLTIYLARNFADFNAFADRFVGGSIAAAVSEDVAYFLRVVVSLA
ncbi:MAG: DUF5009 domain-containing protein, partial [Pedosphaera parvula]|nr:DUF5009 domain-containing protein [Pedosphaera parvula]